MTDALLSMGLPGVVILGLAYALSRVYRSKEKLHEERLSDWKTLTEIVSENKLALRQHAEAMEELTDRLPGWVSGKDRSR